MARPKTKDAERISINMDKEIVTRLRSYADEKGQTLTLAMERIIKAYLDEEDKKQQSQIN